MKKTYKNSIITPKNITITFTPSESIIIPKTSPKYDEVKKLIFEERYDEIYTAISIKNSIISKSEGKLTFENTKFKIGKEELPECITKYLVDFDLNKIPLRVIVNFWNRLKNNPSEESKKDLFAFIKAAKIAITENGCFIAYKYVRDDFMDCHTGTFDNHPGMTPEMPRKDVDPDRNNTCSRGLHVCSWEYLGGHRKIVECLVDPVDVVSVPVDYNNTKMRVCKYKVIRECTAKLEQPLYEDHYKEEGLKFIRTSKDGRLKIAACHIDRLKTDSQVSVSITNGNIYIKSEYNATKNGVVFNVGSDGTVRLPKTFMEKAGMLNKDLVITYDSKSRHLKIS